MMKVKTAHCKLFIPDGSRVICAFLVTLARKVMMTRDSSLLNDEMTIFRSIRYD